MKIKLSFPLLAILFLTAILTFDGYPQKPRRPQSTKPAASSHGHPAAPTSPRFARLWSQVDSLANLGQPKSALRVVDEIYNQAKAGKDDPQVIKTIIFRIRLNSDFRENFMVGTIADLKKEISVSSYPRKQVLQSILAEVYWRYYQNNQYRFRNRTRVASNLPDSLETWDLATLSATITQAYLLSLDTPDSLQRIPIGKFNDILDLDFFNGGKRDTVSVEAARYTPTLYDFLAGRALDYFTSEVDGPAAPAHHFEVDQPWYFAQSFNFTGNRMQIPADPAAPASHALRIYRGLAAFHLKDPDPRALIDTELKRFEFVHDTYILPGKDSLYLDALRKFEQAMLQSPSGTSISYALASFLNMQGQKYQPLISDRNKWDVRSAVEVCEKAIQRFAAAEGSKNCKILVKSIKEPFLQVSTESAVPAAKPSLTLVGVKNLKQLYFRLVTPDPEVYAEKGGVLDRNGYFKFLTSLATVKAWSQVFPDDGDLQRHQAEVLVPAVPAGFWVLLCSPDKDFSNYDQVGVFTPFWSTSISYVNKRNGDGSFSYYFLDRETGMPLKNAIAEAWEKNYDYRERTYKTAKLQRYTADAQGYLLIPPSDDSRRNSSQFLKIYVKDDFLITDNFYQYPVYKSQEQTIIQTMFYTDRAIYRPGQTVYFKGIILERAGDKSRIRPKFSTHVTFSDVNGQKVAEQTLVSNEFGSVNGSFTAPTGVLPGQMTIYNESGSVSFSVEEYKRPTFDVSCEPLEGNYKLGEFLAVTGKARAFAGNPIDAAQVKYRVVRTARFPFWDWGWRWPIPASPQVEIVNGTTTTDAGGKFSVSFQAIPDAGIDKATWPVFDFTLYADVTDLNGETQSVEQGVSVGYKALLVGAGIPEIVNLEKDTILTITTTNLNGRPTPATVTVLMQKLRQPGRIYIKRPWDRPDLHLVTPEDFQSRFPNHEYDDENNPATWAREQLVFEKEVNTVNDSTLNLRNSGSRVPDPGSYVLILKATDPFGEIVEVTRYLTVFAPASKEVPIDALNWFVPLKTSGEPGEAARFIVGSSEDNVNMIYEIRLNDSTVSREWIKLNNRAMRIEIPIKEQYRGNFSVNFLFVKHNRVFQNSQLVTVPAVNKKLGIAFESFRNKLEPGTKELWKIKISTPGGKPANAEFMAGMYDASLDLFRANEWNFSLYQRISGMAPWDIHNAFRINSGQWFAPQGMEDNYFFHPGLKLNWFGTGYFGGGMRYSRNAAGGREKGMLMEAMETPVLSTGQPEGVPAPQATTQDDEAKPGNQPGNGIPPRKAPPEAPLQVRRDFRETAFFYPTLETDSSGSLVLQFTAPESLTKWKLLGLAHTKDLDYGLIEKELVTRKELMVFPNAPRFARQGDTVVFSTKVVNLTDHDLTGTAELTLTDAISLQPVNTLIDSSAGAGSGIRDRAFTVAKGSSTVVSWRFSIPVSARLSLLQYRVSAVSGNFSDGEEKAIPVLTNRMLVTESMPLPVRGKGTTEFSFGKLLKSAALSGNEATLRNYRLTLEFASNPAWYAIQALPALNDKKFETADAIFAAYWSNSMASFIANSSPKIKAVFDSWKNLTPDALLSNLARNQDLKSALLQETPWVMEANSETGRKQKLGLFFDQDNITANLQENLQKLRKLQSPNGGWAWFEGMPENRFITQNILAGLGKLSHLGITRVLQEPASREMVMNAIVFLDGELQKDYENLKKYQPDHLEGNHLGSNQIQYLYARSFFMTDPASRIPDPGSNFSEAFNFYKKQAAKYWLQNDRHLQGMIAVALNRMGNSDVPALILKSLSEKALHSPEMGMYWAGENGYSWYQAPIETQALMIGAFDEILNDRSTVEELRIWLLKQKQTQDWRSPRATLEACYALLLRGTDLLAEDPGVKITLGKEKINSDKLDDVKKEAGTGYFQLSWSGTEITPEMGNITVTKSGEGVAWGAVYWQYFENLDKITPASTPLHLEKKLFAERNSAAGPVLEEIQGHGGDGKLVAGDKLKVRIVVTVDRNLEFVHMKDMRASSLEPVAGLSGYRYQDGLGYYQGTTDQATNFFFDYLPKGTYVFEYALKVNSGGDYSNGITTIQCMYAPEFTAHSEGVRVLVR